MAVEYVLRERVDAGNAKEVEKEMMAIVEGGEVEMILDFSKNTYISSAGLRAILSLQKKLTKAGGSLLLTNVPGAVKEIFDVTGYSRFLKIKQ